MVPLLLFLFGAAFLHPFFIHLRRSWKEPVAAAVYLLAEVPRDVLLQFR